MTASKKKVKELEKKCDRLKKEVENAKLKAKEQQQTVKKKETELAQATSSYLSELLVTNGVSFSDLPELIKKKDSMKLSEAANPQQNY